MKDILKNAKRNILGENNNSCFRKNEYISSKILYQRLLMSFSFIFPILRKGLPIFIIGKYLFLSRLYIMNINSLVPGTCTVQWRSALPVLFILRWFYNCLVTKELIPLIYLTSPAYHFLWFWGEKVSIFITTIIVKRIIITLTS